MSQTPVLQVDRLGKCFKIYDNPWLRSREWISLRRRKFYQSFWSLKQVSFEVYPGEFFGIIGQNGAGKSTLLKIITGAIQQSEGRFAAQGRILSMLELGTDFNDLLTGRENVLRSAELLGFPKDYIGERLPEIIEFAELGEFFDRPIRLYSSGMKARLAFSLFAFLECEILILDEVLAVGDIFFRQKCFERLAKLIERKTAIILVTHDMSAVQQYCDRILLLDHGEMLYQGETRPGVQQYFRLRQGGRLPIQEPEAIAKQVQVETQNQLPWLPDDRFTQQSRSASARAMLMRSAICNATGQPTLQFKQGQQIHLYFEFQLKEEIGVPAILIQITNQFKVLVHGKASLQQNRVVPMKVAQTDRIRFYQCITLNLALGEYVLGVSLYSFKNFAMLTRLQEFTAEELVQEFDEICVCPQVGYFQILPPDGQLISSHFGICDLPGNCSLQVVSGL